ncbi:enoyl-CoA hydratase/isomerase family protein [Gordonia sp. NPDC003424]
MITEYDEVRTRLLENGVGIVEMINPERSNAMTGITLAQLRTAFEDLGGTTECRAIVLTGQGRNFSVGMDMGEDVFGVAAQSVEDRYETLRVGTALILSMREVPQPVIAAVQGHAAGGGFALATAADLRILGAETRFHTPFVKLGVTPGDLGLSYLLPRLIGHARAAELFYRSGTLDAPTAVQLGYASRIVESPLDEALALAAEIAEQPPLSVRMAKDLLNGSIGFSGFREHLAVEMRSQVLTLGSAAHADAAQAFRDRHSVAAHT